MDKLINAVLRLNLIPTYANGQYDDSHEWECECEDEFGECLCRDYDLGDRDEDDHDREMAKEHANALFGDVKACVLAGYDLILAHEAKGDKAEANVVVDEIRAEVERFNQARYAARMAEWLAAQPPLSERRRRYEAEQVEHEAELAKIVADQKEIWAASAARAEAAKPQPVAAVPQVSEAERQCLARAAAFATTSRGRRLLAQRAG